MIDLGMARRCAVALGITIVCGLGSGLAGCTAVEVIQPDPRAYLEIDCRPATAELTVDGAPRGVIEGWRGGVVPLSPGRHRVEIQQDGFYPYRLDVVGKQGTMMHLQLDLIPKLEEIDGEIDQDAGPRRRRHVPLPSDE